MSLLMNLGIFMAGLIVGRYIEPIIALLKRIQDDLGKLNNGKKETPLVAPELK